MQGRQTPIVKSHIGGEKNSYSPHRERGPNQGYAWKSFGYLAWLLCEKKRAEITITNVFCLGKTKLTEQKRIIYSTGRYAVLRDMKWSSAKHVLCIVLLSSNSSCNIHISRSLDQHTGDGGYHTVLFLYCYGRLVHIFSFDVIRRTLCMDMAAFLWAQSWIRVRFSLSHGSIGPCQSWYM